MAAARRVNEILAAREKRSASQHRFRGPEMPRGPAVLRLRTRARVRVSKGVYQAAGYERPFSNRTRVASRRRRRSSSGTVYIANSSAKFSRASRRRRHLRRLNYMPSSPPPPPPTPAGLSGNIVPAVRSFARPAPSGRIGNLASASGLSDPIPRSPFDLVRSFA
jgi:hypothetical protein